MSSLAAVILAGSLTFAAEAQVESEVVRLADVANVAALPIEIRKTAAELPLARFARDADSAAISTEFLASQARARMPTLASWLRATDGEVRLHRPVANRTPLVEAATAMGISKGDRVTVRIASGIFLVERQGIAVTDARIGERLFVRTADRQVIGALCQEARP